MKAQDLVEGVRRKVSDMKMMRWKDDNDLLPKIGRGTLAVYRRRPECVCIDEDTLPTQEPTAPTTLDDEMGIRDEYQEALELYVAWILCNEKGSDKQVAAKADSLYQQFLAEVTG